MKPENHSELKLLRLQCLMTQIFRACAFRLFDQYLSPIEAFDPMCSLPILVARAHNTFLVAHPEPEHAGLFPFELVKSSAPPANAITDYEVRVRGFPSSFFVGAIFLRDAVRQARAPGARPNFIDLNLIMQDFRAMTLQQNSPSAPQGAHPVRQ